MVHQQNQMLKERSEHLQKKVDAQEKILQEAQASMLRTEKLASLGMMAGGIAHEINNPLGGILTMVQLLLTEVEPDSSIYADLKEIESAALHSKAVVENLLKFARQSKESVMGPVNLSTVLEQVKKTTGAFVTNQGCGIEVCHRGWTATCFRRCEQVTTSIHESFHQCRTSHAGRR